MSIESYFSDESSEQSADEDDEAPDKNDGNSSDSVSEYSLKFSPQPSRELFEF